MNLKTLVIAAFAWSALVPAWTAARAQDAETNAQSPKKDKLAKLQAVNRAFQVCFGRSLRRDEAKKLLGMTRDQIVDAMLKSPELAKIYGQRLATFAEGQTDSSNSTEMVVPPAIKTAAVPTTALEETLKVLAKDRHKGAQCGDKPNSVCFATWLVGRVAPTLSAEWIQKNESAIAGWTYAQLLEQITVSSL